MKLMFLSVFSFLCNPYELIDIILPLFRMILLLKAENHKVEFSKCRKAHKPKKLIRPKSGCG